MDRESLSLICLFQEKLSSSLSARMSIECGGRAKTDRFCEKYFLVFFWKESFQGSRFLMIF
jgi:hypothetical protein